MLGPIFHNINLKTWDITAGGIFMDYFHAVRGKNH
jgi:hypothetical protein